MDRQTVIYLRAPAEADQPSLPPGLSVVATIHDDADKQRLAAALQLIDEGQADTLLTPSLNAVADSFAALAGLLDWLERAGATLIAQDVGLDTATPAGRRTLALLNEIATWERRRRPRGRPGLSAVAPDLAERITAMRESGQSLHAIAGTLNQERVPTPRGGSVWRASSVQSALGYRRPRPPAPGMPPPKPPRPGPKPKPHKPPKHP